MVKDSILGLKIAYYRRLCGMTQEELAERIGVSAQAVSKWEQQVSCPDVLLLPRLAKIFGTTIDELFGVLSPKEAIYRHLKDVPWQDDEKIRIAVYDGQKLLEQSSYEVVEGVNVIDVQFHGHPFNISGVFKIVCTENGQN
ncbi:MAG: helix-turn-helix transcriptional regulator [Clostridia bacterium]|nr:helix-turn-helix transcriptional regulator [Clostridia bacterium]